MTAAAFSAVAAFLSFGAAIFAAIVATLQWKTAQEKVILDLFDRRFSVYDKLRSIVGRHLGSGIDERELFNFGRVSSRAQFLFGPEITTFLEQRRIDLSRDWHERRRGAPDPVLDEDRRAAVQAEIVARKDRLSDFFKDFDELVAPYMTHHQKAVGESYPDVVLRIVRLKR
jgi:hypothetical protein